jgi:hypothetical protein
MDSVSRVLHGFRKNYNHYFYSQTSNLPKSVDDKVLFKEQWWMGLITAIINTGVNISMDIICPYDVLERSFEYNE